jgi:hypothetical protein
VGHVVVAEGDGSSKIMMMTTKCFENNFLCFGSKFLILLFYLFEKHVLRRLTDEVMQDSQTLNPATASPTQNAIPTHPVHRWSRCADVAVREQLLMQRILRDDSVQHSQHGQQARQLGQWVGRRQRVGSRRWQRRRAGRWRRRAARPCAAQDPKP